MRVSRRFPAAFGGLYREKQVTGLEGQVAFLAPLRPKLRQACALGRKDRQRGDVLMRRLIEVISLRSKHPLLLFAPCPVYLLRPRHPLSALPLFPRPVREAEIV